MGCCEIFHLHEISWYNGPVIIDFCLTFYLRTNCKLHWHFPYLSGNHEKNKRFKRSEERQRNWQTGSFERERWADKDQDKTRARYSWPRRRCQWGYQHEGRFLLVFYCWHTRFFTRKPSSCMSLNSLNFSRIWTWGFLNIFLSSSGIDCLKWGTLFC